MFGRNAGWLLIVAIVVIALLIIGWIAFKNNQATVPTPLPTPTMTTPSASPTESPSESPTPVLSPSPAASQSSLY